MYEVRPEKPSVLRGVRVQSKLQAIAMKTDCLADRQGVSELGPAFGKSALVHQDEVETSLQGAKSVPEHLHPQLRTHQDSGFDKLHVLRFDRLGNCDRGLG